MLSVPRKGTVKGKHNPLQKKIKWLLEPAHLCYGLSLYWYLGLVEYKYSRTRFFVKFQDFWNKFSFLFGQLWELEIRLCGLEVGWAEVIRQAVSFLLADSVTLCVWGGGWAGSAWSGIKCCSSSKVFVTLIFLDHVYYCEIFLARFLISFVFNIAAVAFGF